MWLGFIKNSHCFSFRPTLSSAGFLFMFHCHMFKKHTASGVAALSQHCSPHPPSAYWQTDPSQVFCRRPWSTSENKKPHRCFHPVKQLFLWTSFKVFVFCPSKSWSRAPWSRWCHQAFISVFQFSEAVHAFMMVSCLYSVYLQWHPDFYMSYCGGKKGLN